MATYTVYKLFGADGALAYIGHTSNLGKRLEEHRKGAASSGMRGAEISRVETIAFATKAEAVAVERELILVNRPPLNVEAAAVRRPPRRKDDREYHGMVRRMIRAYARRVDKGDVTTLARFRELETELRQHVDAAALDLHDQGFSWTEIGTELGISRQAARQRFARRSTDAA